MSCSDSAGVLVAVRVGLIANILSRALYRRWLARSQPVVVDLLLLHVQLLLPIELLLENLLRLEGIPLRLRAKCLVLLEKIDSILV